MAAKKSIGTEKTVSQNLLIKILWYLAEFWVLSYLINENFKMEVEQTNHTFNNYDAIILLIIYKPVC